MSKNPGAPAVGPRVLVVDDDGHQRSMLLDFLAAHGFAAVEAPSAEEALRVLAAGQVRMVISDVQMPGMSGLELLRKLRETHRELPVLLITAYGDIKGAVAAVQDGAINYLEKPIDLDELLDALRHGLGIAVEAPGAAAAGAAPLPPLPAGLVVESPAMRDVVREVAQIAPSEVRVLITGDNGTGKEVVADLIHAWSKRAGKPMVKVNCAAIPENLMESELFGHERGAFTGAQGARVGLFQQADGGTILLDEIGEMPLPLQAKLLRVTEQGTFLPIGGKERSCDVRILASTNRDLEAEVAAGRFREDLFFRLNTFEIYVPGLKERREDIIPLARAFASAFGGGHKRFSPAVSSLLTLHDWPGNVRELRNSMERAVLLCAGSDVIVPEHLPGRLRRMTTEPPAKAPEEAVKPLEEVERLTILQVLQKCGYNRSQAAKELGMSRRNFTYKVRRLREAGHQVDPS